MLFKNGRPYTGGANQQELPPGVIRVGVNAVKAAARVVKTVAQGKPLFESTAEVERRLAICKACSFYDAHNDRCNACGCYGLKRRLTSERGRCPKHKW